MVYLTRQCGNGSSRIAQGKAAATKALNAGGSTAVAEATMLANAEQRGATAAAIAKLQEGFAARVSGAQVAKAQAGVDAARTAVDKTQSRLDALARSLRSVDDFNQVNKLRDDLTANKRKLMEEV